MNTKPSSTKSTLAVLLIIGLFGVAYYFYNSYMPSSTDSITADNSDSDVGAHVLSLLNQIQSLNIDSTIFKDPGFNTLVDYSVEIPPVPVGRPNPFAPLPGYPSQSVARTH
jgi:hypothetical protein